MQWYQDVAAVFRSINCSSQCGECGSMVCQSHWNEVVSCFRKSSLPAGRMTWEKGRPLRSWLTCWRSYPNSTADCPTLDIFGSLQSRYPRNEGWCEDTGPVNTKTFLSFFLCVYWEWNIRSELGSALVLGLDEMWILKFIAANMTSELEFLAQHCLLKWDIFGKNKSVIQKFVTFVTNRL